MHLKLSPLLFELHATSLNHPGTLTSASNVTSYECPPLGEVK
jgi:hypothetical protein